MYQVLSGPIHTPFLCSDNHEGAKRVANKKEQVLPCCARANKRVLVGCGRLESLVFRAGGGLSRFFVTKRNLS
jgi:hypothetical protein